MHGDYNSDSSHPDFDIGDGFYSTEYCIINLKLWGLSEAIFISFLVPFFNRRESTMSFVKPSLSALHRKQKMEEERVRRKEEGLAQEEVEMEEEEEVGEEGVGGEREEEREEERGRFFVEKVKISLKEALEAICVVSYYN